MAGRFKYILSVFICVGIFYNVHSQSFKWLKNIGSGGGYEDIVSIVTDKNGNSDVLLRGRNLSSGSFNLNIDTFSFVVQPGNAGTAAYMVKIDSSGKVLLAKYLGSFSLSIQNLSKDSQENYYFSAGFASFDSLFILNKYYKKADGNVLFLKLDSVFNIKWVSQAGNSFSTDYKLRAYDNKLYFLSQSRGVAVFGDSTYSFDNTSPTYVAGELSKTDGSVLWSKYFHKNLAGNGGFSINGILRVSNNLYLWGYSSALRIINSDSFFSGAGFIIKTDLKGDYISRFSLKTKSSFSITCLSSDGKDLYFGGSFMDTLKFGNKVILPDYPSGSGKSEFFTASLTSGFTPKWFYHPKVLTINSNLSGHIDALEYNSSFLYFGARLYTNISIGPAILNSSNNVSGEIMFFKSDLMGNVLWATKANAGGYFYDLQSSLNAVFGVGTFQNQISFGNFTNTSNGYSDGFITKISDNAIIRGEVSKGPYCAGDTFRVPYIKIGDYDTGNYFIAELSDENGEFNGGQRELGRLKSNSDSVITGILPLFQVSSSEKYRIRIMSTAPPVQSYYKVDTLRLLIYSRDKADPGRDTTICKGDTLLLRTYGGTKWTWSPYYRMQDSTKAVSKAWPEMTTIYQIIIADSSGCGEADTAVKTVFVRNELSIRVHTPLDTAICTGGIIPLIASFHGGDSTGYTYQWTAIDSKGNYSFPGSGTGKNTDTLLFTMPAGEKDSMRFQIYLSDGCTPKNTYEIFTLKVKKTSAVSTFEHNDTNICPGKSVPVIAHFKGSDAKLLNWIWQEKNSAGQWALRKTGSHQQSDTFNYTLPLNWAGQKELRVVLTDLCSDLKDTSIFRLTPKDTLQLTLNTLDTTLCKGQIYTWRAKGKGGYAPDYRFIWTDNITGDTLSQTDSLSVTAITAQSIRLTLSDGCMPGSISKSFSINVNPALKAAIMVYNTVANDTVLCYGRELNLTAGKSGGQTSAYSHEWKLDHTTLGTKDTLAIKTKEQFSDAGESKTLSLILNDGCTQKADTASVVLTVLPELKATGNVQDSVCHGNQAMFKVNVAGGKGSYAFIWLDENNVPQGNTDSLNLLNNENTEKNISRKAIVSDGCSENDTITLNTIFLAPLRLQLSANDTCPSAQAIISAAAGGGKPEQHQILWYLNNTEIGSGAQITVNPNGQTQTYTAILKDDCSSKNDTASITIGSKPLIRLTSSGFCLGDQTEIQASQLNANKLLPYNWKINDIQQPETDSVLKRIFPAIGNYRVKAEAGTGPDCRGADSADIYILAKPVAAFRYAHFGSSGNEIRFRFINHSADANAWLWQFDKGDTSQRKNPDYTFADTGRKQVILIASNQGKCFDTAMMIVPVYPKIEFYFPNAFSPNGNFLNESFGLPVSQSEFVSEYSLKIFNRWGEMLFSTENPNEHWQAVNIQQGIYIWMAGIRDIYGILREMQGVVEVLR